MSKYSRLEHQVKDGILFVRPLVRVLGSWDGGEPPDEAVEFRNQLRMLLAEEAAPLLLDLRDFEFVRNWDWLLVLLARDCKLTGRKLAICVRPALLEVFAITKRDRLIPVRADYEEAASLLTNG